jgi:hypothetical protein
VSRGPTSGLRQRHISQRVSRQASFYGTRPPDTVPEANEGSAPTTPKLSTEMTLPSYKWALLCYLSLSDNGLTILPTEPLSSNLLVLVPSGLSSLFNLVSLNLSDNMINSVLGIYTQLGPVLSLNLSCNRLELICGLERLLALEHVDLRHNAIGESAEVGRLGRPLDYIRETKTKRRASRANVVITTDVKCILSTCRHCKGCEDADDTTKTQAKDRSPSRAPPQIEVQLPTPSAETQAEQIPFSPTRPVQRSQHVHHQTEGYPSREKSYPCLPL